MAELVAIRGFGYLEDAPEMRGITSLRNYLMDYSAMNDRTHMTQFHAAISCKGSEYSKDELIGIAWKYLDKMGYNNEGQPILMYFHHDTDNNHLHIITSRISPDGKKIPDSMENIRSLKAIEEVMNMDVKYQNSEMMARAKSYHFESVSQFMAVFETSGYEAFIQDGDICIKRGGQVQDKIAVKDAEKLCRKNGEAEKKRIRQLRAILQKYRDQSSSREELESMLKKKFGISIKFLGKEFSPYGYMVVDNASKTVFKGGDILGIKDLLQFQSREEKLQKVDFFIEDKLRENPLATTFDLNRDLHRFYGCHIRHGCIIMGKEKVELADYLVQKIKYNDKVSWVQGFSPANEQQVRLLSKMFHVSADHLHISENNGINGYQSTIGTINFLLADSHIENDSESIYDRLSEEGIWTYRFEDKLFCVNPSKREVVDLEASGIDTSKFKSSRSADIETSEHKHNVTQGRPRPISNEIGSSDRINYNPDANRNNYGVVDDERAMIRRS
ncbi:MAG: relaxase/mobilization nuclease domain-containing protein [Clostridiales bacterium]|nr:relaxase/mobilization nuclease domain-containing protein [Clostridiales bacterium]